MSSSLPLIRIERRTIVASFLRGARFIAVFAVAAVAFVALHRFYSQKFFDGTGKAQWIWQKHRLASRDPVAFFATRDFAVPAVPTSARLKIAADPEYTLFLNGQEIAGGASERVYLDEYDVTRYLRPGRNRIVAAIRSGEGVGGLLIALDLDPSRQNALVSDPSWRIFTRWDPRLLYQDVPGGAAPYVLGEPPIGKWNWPEGRPGRPYGEERFLAYPSSMSRMESWLPETRTIGGVAVSSRRKAQALLFDFGRVVEGRGRLELAVSDPEMVRVRYFEDVGSLDRDEEIRALVVAEGEEAVVDPQRRRFRYMLVFSPKASASVVSEKPV
jgi:hypothetical protein